MWNATSIVQDLNSYVFISYGDNDYTTGTSYKDINLPLSRDIMAMTLKSIWWWGSSSGDLRSVEYLFIDIIPRSTLTQSGSTC